MSHAHLSVHHLLRQLESGRVGRSGRMSLPDWLRSFIENAAEQFEPEAESARAGYICSHTDDGWKVTLFLGMTELIGGAEDGTHLPTGFIFNLQAIRDCFDQIDHVLWKSLPSGSRSNGTDVDQACVLIDGILNEQRLQLRVTMRPPTEMGPGLLRDADGHCTLA